MVSCSVWKQRDSHSHTPLLLPYLGVDLVKQGEKEGVEVSQEEGEDASELPLEGNSRMVVLQLGDGLKQGRAHQTQQRHDDLQLSKTFSRQIIISSHKAAPFYLCISVFLSTLNIFSDCYSYSILSGL